MEEDIIGTCSRPKPRLQKETSKNLQQSASIPHRRALRCGRLSTLLCSETAGRSLSCARAHWRHSWRGAAVGRRGTLAGGWAGGRAAGTAEVTCGCVRATDLRRALVRALGRALGRCRVHVHVRVYDGSRRSLACERRGLVLPRGGSIGRAMRCGWGAPLWCLRSTLDRHNPRVMSYFYSVMSCN